ncbi:hypothetical protein E2C01_013351 [Portunus trituberculatus]|uniref:Uncharacterized protein n=1 Tax=Portunus trituberculatus TaxID=210409 RepID=A0A5B7DGE3_PORTR|nr:hypothetical protein [Portunus trituberculatus]
MPVISPLQLCPADLLWFSSFCATSRPAAPLDTPPPPPPPIHTLFRHFSRYFTFFYALNNGQDDEEEEEEEKEDEEEDEKEMNFHEILKKTRSEVEGRNKPTSNNKYK